MTRVAMIGNAGGGKSILPRKLAAEYALLSTAYLLARALASPSS